MSELNSAEDAALLLAQAQRHGLVQEHVRFVRTEPLRWSAWFKDCGGFRLEWSEPWGRLVLIAQLGVPPAKGERVALNLALSYNSLWQQVGNLRMARDGEGGELLLIGELGPADSQLDDFCAGLLRFEGLRRLWREAMARAGQGGGDLQALPLGLIERI